MQNKSRPYLVGTLVDVLRGIRIVELMELPLDAEMAPKIEGSVEPKSPQHRRSVVGTPQVEGYPYLEVERATRGWRNLSIQPRTVASKSTTKHQ